MQAQVTQLYKQQAHKQDANNLLEWTRNRLEAKEIELTNILRWEDDGGLIVQTTKVATAYPNLDIEKDYPL